MGLKEYIEKNFAGNASLFAKKIGTTRQAVNYWINGIRKPSIKLAQKIHNATNGKVTLADWK